MNEAEIQEIEKRIQKYMHREDSDVVRLLRALREAIAIGGSE